MPNPQGRVSTLALDWGLFAIAKGKKPFCLLEYFRGRFFNPIHAYKAVILFDTIAVLFNAKSVPFLSCHPVVALNRGKAL